MLKSLQEKFVSSALVFYDWVQSWAGRLSQFFKLPYLSDGISRYFSKPAALVLVESFVAVSLAVCYFFIDANVGTS